MMKAIAATVMLALLFVAGCERPVHPGCLPGVRSVCTDPDGHGGCSGYLSCKQ